MTTKISTCTCERPKVTTMDFRSKNLINRMCLGCGAHRYGMEGSEKDYTRKEWDAYVNDVETA